MKTCFIIMPFSQALIGEQKLTQIDLDYIYHNMIKKAVEEFQLEGKKYFAEVLRYEERVGSIIKGIVQKVKDADLVIADLTGLNPNVMYELGVRHALKRGTIMLTQNFDYFPSDLRDYMAMTYSYSINIHEQPKNYENFKRDLHKNIEELLKSKKVDSPVLEYIEKKEFYQNEEKINEIKEIAVSINGLFGDFYDVRDILYSIYDDNIDETLARELMNFHLNCFLSKLQSLTLTHNAGTRSDDLINVASMLVEVQKKFAISDYFTQLNIDGENPFVKNTLKEMLSEKILDPIELKSHRSLRYCSISEIFEEGEFLYNFIENISHYMENEAEKLGVLNEIIELINPKENLKFES